MGAKGKEAVPLNDGGDDKAGKQVRRRGRSSGLWGFMGW